MGKIFLQIDSAAVAFIDILIAAWEGLKEKSLQKDDVFMNMTFVCIKLGIFVGCLA